MGESPAPMSSSCLFVMVKRSSMADDGLGKAALRFGSRALACASASLS
jgi:hypothetical protein